MSGAAARALSVARPVIQVLTVLNLLYAAVIAALLVFSYTIEGWPQRPLGIELTTAHPWAASGLRGIIALGIVAAGIVHVVLRTLLRIVDTVRGGDPFIAANAQRLTRIAWCVLSIEVIRLAILAIAGAVWENGKLPGPTLAPWFAVLMLFVLAGVFAHGARMRADLDGTV